VSETGLDVFGAGGARLDTIAMPPSVRANDAAIHPDGRTLALTRARPAAGRGEIVTHSLARPEAPARRLFAGSGSFDGIAWSPDGRWLLAGWPDADQWLLIRSAEVRKVRAIANIRRQFDPGGVGPAPFPTISGWCCR
jgi:sugar lactone lactonase YvrE